MIARLRAYAELMRISNVLTSVADVWMGMIVATGTLAPWTLCVPLTAASVLLYVSGMVLNDVFDAKQDEQERNARPIPSGRVSRTEAGLLGVALMIGGLASAAFAGQQHELPNALPCAIALAVCILVYDAWLKRTILGPIAMGLCRGFNVWLGFSAFGLVSHLKGMPKPPAATYFIPLGIIIYVVGLTLFSRREANTSKRLPLIFSTMLSLSGIIVMAIGPQLCQWNGYGDAWPAVPLFRWYVLWAVIAMLVGRRYAAAVLQPTPKHVQSAVGNAIQGIILIDAALAWGYAGPFWGLMIFALLPPTMLLSRFIPQT